MYNYSLVETNGAGRVVIAGNTTDTELFVERNVTVSPFTNYTATVVAFTSAGSGDSVMEIALSPEAGNEQEVDFIPGRIALHTYY